MLKHLLVAILFTLLFSGVNAQTHTDSVTQHPGDTAKILPVDTTTKKTTTDSAAKHAADTTIKHAPAKTTTKAAAVKHPTNDSTIKHSPVKSLSDKKYDAYVKGDDLFDMSLVAELNHYPLPDKVLKFKSELSLSPIQIGKVTAIANELHRKKLEMGQFVIHNERMMDSLFRKRMMDDGLIIFYSNRSGLYYGEFRNAILQACYATEKLLSDGQIKQLETLEKKN